MVHRHIDRLDRWNPVAESLSVQHLGLQKAESVQKDTEKWCEIYVFEDIIYIRSTFDFMRSEVFIYAYVYILLKHLFDNCNRVDSNV